MAAALRRLRFHRVLLGLLGVLGLVAGPDAPLNPTVPPPPPSTPPPPAPSPHLQISPPGTLLSHEMMIDWKVSWPDAGLYSIKNAHGRQFFMEGGPAGDDPGTPWSVFSSGGSGDMVVQDLVGTNIAVENFPCPDGFSEPCVHLDPAPGGIMLNKCDSSSATQRWNTSAGDPSVVTTVQSEASLSCWEVNGCGGPDIDTDYGCKKLPTGPPPWEGCNNMAWIFAQNGSIISGIPSVPGGTLDQCLQVSPQDNVTVQLGLCQGSQRELWAVKGSAIQSLALGGCIDNAPNPAVNASTVGMWVANVYDAGDDGGILAFIHMEFRWHVSEPDGEGTVGDVGCYFRFGLAHSGDGGESFQWVGYVVEPALSFEHTVHGSRYGRPAWFPNMGLANYIEKDGFFQILYGDTNGLGPNNEIQNATDGVGQAGNPDQGVAAVRAKIADVVAAAKQHKSVEWKKYLPRRMIPLKFLLILPVYC
eukprot:COSAG02_NODE_2822_length_7957_cov_4.624841_1_plen_474_part_00